MAGSKQWSLLMAGNNDEVYHKRSERYAKNVKKTVVYTRVNGA